ncbi:MAG: hypothetical protein GF333_06175 [Candidatus Omnitrophica bacterium]|nr:hypothetical protein [Candidatus Omnitrophota bacterium]
MIFFCIAEPKSSIGFKLAGVRTREASTQREAREALKVALSLKDLGVILVTERVAVFLRQEIDTLIYQRQLPLVLEVPSQGMKTERKSVNQFIKDAVGISI